MSSGTWNSTFKISTGELAGLKDYLQFISPDRWELQKIDAEVYEVILSGYKPV